MYVTLGQLRAFERIVRLGSFHAAALELKLSQPSVSQRIRELEAALNTPLFVRRGPRVSLTAEGHALIEYADRMLATAGELVERFRTRDPLKGTGAGTFEFVWNRDARRSYFVRDAHSLYIESLGELGLPGALLVVAALGALLAGAVRAALAETEAAGRGAAAGCCAALLVFCVTAGVDWMWESTAVAVMALAAGSVAAGASAAPAPRRAIGRRAPLAVGALLLVAVQAPVLGAASQIRASRQAAAGGNFEQALIDATDAVHVAPWQASGYVQRALLLERLGLGTRAAADARRATRREPTNWEHWLILARIEAERGDVRSAVAAVRRSAALNPHAPLFRAQD